MAKLIFLGSKGEIEEFTDKHQFNASLLIVSGDTRLLVDYGKLRRYTLEELRPDAILITHAHPDPYAWLYEDIKTSIPVFVTQETYNYGKYRPDNPRIFQQGEDYTVGTIAWSAYRVEHSIRCPAVGFKLKVDGKTLVYNSDLVSIIEPEKILSGADYYIGDGSSIQANLVRRREDRIVGHTRMSTQINWCTKYQIKNIIFTHLGKETLGKEEEFKQAHPEVVLAYDGMEVEI